MINSVIREKVTGKPHIWFAETRGDYGAYTRCHFYARGRVWWGGSFPVIRIEDGFKEWNLHNAQLDSHYIDKLRALLA